MAYLHNTTRTILLNNNRLTDFSFFKTDTMISFEGDCIYINGSYEINARYDDYLGLSLNYIIEQDGYTVLLFDKNLYIKIDMPDNYNTDGIFHNHPYEGYLEGIDVVYLPYLTLNKFQGWY